MRLASFSVLLAVVLLLGGEPPAARGETGEIELLARVRVRGDGFVRVGNAKLEELGVDGSNPVVVMRAGRYVNVCREAGPEDLVFLAHDTATGTSRDAVYELWLYRDLMPEPQVKESADFDAAAIRARPVTAARVLATDFTHGALEAGRPEVYDVPHAPTWFLASIPPSKATAIVLESGHAAKGANQTLDASVFATRIGKVALRAMWGGHDLGVAEGPGAQGGAIFRWTVPAELVPTEKAPLGLFDVSPTPPPPPANDVSQGRGTLWVDRVTLRGEVTREVGPALRSFDLPAEGIALSLPSPDAELFLARVGPDGTWLGPPRNVATPEDAPTVRVLGPSEIPPGTRLFAATRTREADEIQVVEAQYPPNPVASAAGAKHVILATPPLVEPARRLAAHRTATGTKSVVIPVTDVYASAGYGEPSHDAIRRFLVALMESNAPPAYVVLAGDATLDRTDLIEEVTIPAPFARTMYNGATAADRLYGLPPDGSPVGGVSIGRLPFREAEDLARYVERLIRYETAPPADPSRRLMRFVTNEARFGAFIDRLLEGMFRGVVANDIPEAYDIEVTFASLKSPFLWPPREFNAKVIQGFNDGCLFYTYVGHGFAQGLDSLRAGWERFNVLHIQDVDKVRCEGTAPACFVIACTTAIFDSPTGDGVGEALLKNPAGPIAYWGATRVCHPAANTLLGRSLARTMARGEGGLRLGEIVDTARDDVLAERDPSLGLLKIAVKALAGGADAGRLVVEGSQMYALLGDPALKVAFPRSDVVVTPKPREGGRVVDVELEAALPDGTRLHVSIEVPRNKGVSDPAPVADPLDTAAAETIRANHRRMNDFRIVHGEATLEGGRASLALTLPEGRSPEGLVVKAWCIASGDVHQGAVRIEASPSGPAAPSGTPPPQKSSEPD